MPQVIALLTDFGSKDPYLAQMKGVLLTLSPSIALVDISHEAEPFNPAHAGFLLNASRAFFPEGTIFIAVVDPGVGGMRKIVVLEKFGQTFLAPDNGLLSLVLAAPGQARAYDLTGAKDLLTASATFHGRDVFAPIAARLSNGEPARNLGPEISLEDLVCLPWARPVYTQGEVHEVSGTVLHVDRFGNCLLNLLIDPWLARIEAWPRISLKHPKARPVVLAKTYAGLPENTLGLLAGSQGVLELCLNQGPAARDLSLGIGHAVCLTSTRDTA
ncbi:MAG: SAM-dependent chlorinase/fluorinase [Thermodesulfobacteriota bacterium]|nr:SAM-dependent chlorinase/fluorinase [Thermodesulfobacteriota bacterium]